MDVTNTNGLAAECLRQRRDAIRRWYDAKRRQPGSMDRTMSDLALDLLGVTPGTGRSALAKAFANMPDFVPPVGSETYSEVVSRVGALLDQLSSHPVPPIIVIEIGDGA